MNNALADSKIGIIWTEYGEVLRSVNGNDVNYSIIENILKRPKITPIYKLYVLHYDETIDYEIPQDDIIIDSGNFSENYQNGQRKSINVNLVNIDGKYNPNINSIWMNNKFRLDVGLEFNGVEYLFARGIYILGNPSSSHKDSDKQVSLTLVDKFAMFEGKMGTLETTYEIPVGTNIQKAIYGILNLDNGMGYPMDSKPVLFDDFVTTTMPFTLTKDAGSTLGEMLLELGTILNAEVFYNSQGNLCYKSINETTNDNLKSSLWDYEDGKRDYFTANTQYGFEDVINEVHVVGDNVNNDIFSAISKNTNPASPLCIGLIGRRVLYINDSNIYNDSLAQQRANYELRRQGLLKVSMTIEVAFNPLLFVNNIITITDSHYDLERARFLIQSISYSIGSQSKMTITCSNLDNLESFK